LCEASLDQFFASKKGFHGVMPKPIVVFYQLATGLEFIHKMGLIHGDIKPQKVLIWVNPRHNEEILMKFSGFGFSQRVNETGSYSRSGTVETLDWLAPEILELHDDEKVGQNKGGACQRDMKKITRTHKSDVFAEGLLFGYFLLNGLHLFGSPVQRKPNILENKPVNLSSK
jgi:serine/threonine-protein kinase/endoribonuclease IRE1